MIVDLETVATRDDVAVDDTAEGPTAFLKIASTDEVLVFLIQEGVGQWLPFRHLVPITTVASARCPTLKEARDSFAELRKHCEDAGDQTWIYFQKRIREWEDRWLPSDEVSRQMIANADGKVDYSGGEPAAQVWADVVILKGFWVFEEGYLKPAKLIEPRV